MRSRRDAIRSPSPSPILDTLRRRERNDTATKSGDHRLSPFRSSPSLAKSGSVSELYNIMPVDYPYMMSINKIGPILEKIEKAAKPPRFSQEFLKNLGFGASNDRAVIPLFRKLGFLNDSGVPTEYYDQLKDSTRHKAVLGDRIKALYSDLFTLKHCDPQS